MQLSYTQPSVGSNPTESTKYVLNLGGKHSQPGGVGESQRVSSGRTIDMLSGSRDLIPMAISSIGKDDRLSICKAGFDSPYRYQMNRPDSYAHRAEMLAEES